MKRRQLLDSTQIDVLIFELANACAQLVDADSYRVYATDGTDATTHVSTHFRLCKFCLITVVDYIKYANFSAARYVPSNTQC
jgi:hypothetical protein